MHRLLLLVVVASCVSGGGSSAERGGAGDSPATRVVSPDTGVRRTDLEAWTTTSFSAAPDIVWSAVKKFYATFEIPLTFEDRAAHELGNQSFYKSRAMGGRAMTTWVNCGTTLTGDAAATNRIFMTSVTEILPDGQSGSKMRTSFVATSQDIAQASGGRVPCVSTGRFEAAMAEQVRQSIAK
jgi:hypothetical protein